MNAAYLTPAITLFNEDGTLDLASQERLFNNLIDQGVDGILVEGSSSEFFAMPMNQRREMAKFAIEKIDHRVKLIIGTSHMVADEIISFSNFCLDAGADAVMILPPYYFHFGPSALLQYYDRLAEQIHGDIYIYNFPDNTGYTIPPETVLALAKMHPNIVLKDIVARKKIADAAMLENVIRFMFDNIGNPCSTTKIANTLKSSGHNISVHTVENYLKALCESFVLYKADRYDIKGKQYLRSGAKYYVADIGLRYYLLGQKPADLGHILENVVYLELLRRGYEVFVGKSDKSEIDFIAINEEDTEYYQVALTVRDEKTLLRELAPLESVNDHNGKYLLTLDDDPPCSHNGIKQVNALDWLLKE